MKITKQMRNEQRKLVNELVTIKDRLFRAGLVLTHHELDNAVKMVGYEIGAHDTGTWPDSALKAMGRD